MSRIVLLDGAVGTSLWEKAEAAGIDKVVVWRYNIEHPELVTSLTKDYIDAGSEIVLTNTFGANGPAVKRSSSYDAAEVVRKGVAATKAATEGTGVKTCLAVGPVSMLLEPYGDLEEDECREIYDNMIGAGMEEKPDCIFVQTFFDLAMLKIAAEAARQYDVPVFAALSFEKIGKTIMGNSVEDMIKELEPLGLAAIGMNCSIGPDQAVPIIKEFSEKTDIPLIFKPNAGKPISSSDGTFASAYTAEMFASEVAPALKYVTYVGGCCGSNPEYIRELKKYIAKETD